METAATLPSSVIELISLVMQGLGLVVLMTVAWGLSKQLTTLVLKLEMLGPIPAQMIEFRLNQQKVQSSLDHLWERYRAHITEEIEKEGAQLEKIERFLMAWDNRGDGFTHRRTDDK